MREITLSVLSSSPEVRLTHANPMGCLPCDGMLAHVLDGPHFLQAAQRLIGRIGEHGGFLAPGKVCSGSPFLYSRRTSGVWQLGLSSHSALRIHHIQR